ncbi:hypothetical protein B1991_14475 [Rhodanobacter lindaniclasticus]|uniref:HTH cro/C1-type domain-containing protein n=2 Tax=Rhodanobacter lindaniclasticus TaxID=75310 RepID=A0A4S3KCI0_9GAMM|nr:hypothetical protein B1991_14475 [Rhodanobacter lindaniclasticus]
METIGDRVLRLRKAKGIERKDLAHAVELSYTGLADLESGKAKSSTRLHRIADALDVTPAYLETGKEDHYVYPTADSHSQPMRLDPERIAELATVLAERWKNVPGGFDLRNEEHAAHFVLCYELYINMKERPVPENTVAFSAALTSPQGATGNERGTDVPVAGTVGRKTGKGGKR